MLQTWRAEIMLDDLSSITAAQTALIVVNMANEHQQVAWQRTRTNTPADKKKKKMLDSSSVVIELYQTLNTFNACSNILQ